MTNKKNDNKNYNKRSNKSSLIKIIISDITQKDINEVKVRYNKRAGVDVIKFNKNKYTKKI